MFELARRLRQAARSAPRAVAVEAEDGWLNYADLLRAAERLTIPADVAVVNVRASSSCAFVVQACAAALQEVGLRVVSDGTVMARTGQRGCSARGASERSPRIAPFEVCFTTSGSTGPSTAVEVPSEQVRFTLEALTRQFQIETGEKIGCWLPLHFDYGYYQLLLSVSAGATLQLRSPSTVTLDWISRLRQDSADWLPLVPRMVRLLVRLLVREGGRHIPARHVTVTGEAFPNDVLPLMVELMPELLVWSMYGLTECKRVSIHSPRLPRDVDRAVGRALPGTAVTIRDARGRPLPPGAVGEICVEGPHLTFGDWRQRQTPPRWRPDGVGGYLQTGDSGWMNADGNLIVEGRISEWWPPSQRATECQGLLEHNARTLAGADCVLVRCPGGELTCFVEASRSLLGFPRKDIREVTGADRVIPLASFPQTSTGKVDRKRLAEWGGRACESTTHGLLN